jgi:hypothetical protein
MISGMIIVDLRYDKLTERILKTTVEFTKFSPPESPEGGLLKINVLQIPQGDI